MKTIQILGTGCPKCRALGEATERAAREAGIEYRIVHVEDLERILSFGVMAVPALVVDGMVRSTGRVPSPAELREYLTWPR